MLTIKQRQNYLKNLGYYTGKIDGKEGALLKEAYKKLQEDYFVREKDIDGIYGKNTDILLQNAYNVKRLAPNFKLEEFKCGCGGKHCTGYPGLLSTQLLKNVQRVRTKFGATTITSGMRCKGHNDATPGSSKTSRHMPNAASVCKALDIYNQKTRTEAGRRVVMSYWKLLPNWNYTYCNIGGNYPNMGNAVHIDVK